MCHTHRCVTHQVIYGCMLSHMLACSHTWLHVVTHGRILAPNGCMSNVTTWHVTCHHLACEHYKHVCNLQLTR